MAASAATATARSQLRLTMTRVIAAEAGKVAVDAFKSILHQDQLNTVKDSKREECKGTFFVLEEIGRRLKTERWYCGRRRGKQSAIRTALEVR